MIKVFLVDDEIVIREGIRNTFPWEEYGYTLVGEAPDGEIALPMIRDANPDILITDIRMPFMDGMALCREVKRQMPWVSVIILSGYDDFAYAREAISLGVQEYMLKPISLKELREVLDRISNRIRENRITQESIEKKRRQLASSDQFLREKLLSTLFSDEMDAHESSVMLEQMRSLGINLAAKRYVVVDISFTQEDGGHSLGRSLIYALAENNGAVYACSAKRGARALVLGDSDEDTEERAYGFANSALRELESIGCTGVLLALGDIVDDFSKIHAAMQSARHTRHVVTARKDNDMRIVGVCEMSDTPAKLSDLRLRPLYDQLLYISPSEFDEVFSRYAASLGAAEIHLPTATGYIHVESLMTAGRIVREAGGDPDQVLSRQWLEPSENTADTSHARELLRQAIAYRSAHAPSRTNSAIEKARSFLSQNYTNPNLMLQDVAKAVSMSNSRFSTIFAQETGFTFTEYLTALRIAKAKELLRATALRSSQIATQVGYNDPHYFSYLFKKSIGQTPSEYRKAKTL